MAQSPGSRHPDGDGSASGALILAKGSFRKAFGVIRLTARRVGHRVANAVECRHRYACKQDGCAPTRTSQAAQPRGCGRGRDPDDKSGTSPINSASA